jgi:hypothetical protein
LYLKIQKNLMYLNFLRNQMSHSIPKILKFQNHLKILRFLNYHLYQTIHLIPKFR